MESERAIPSGMQRNPKYRKHSRASIRVKTAPALGSGEAGITKPSL
jgi:hypothetical protein